MEDHNLIDVSSAVGTSGWFLRLARDGQLNKVSDLVIKRTELMIDLAEVENLLVAFNDPRAISEFVVWCVNAKKEFISEFVKRVRKLEVRKASLHAKLRAVDGKLDELTKEEPLEGEWTTSTEPMTSLVPRVVRKSNPYRAKRNEIIDQNHQKSTLEICTILDRTLGWEGIVDHRYFPERWAEDFGIRNFVNAYRDPRTKNCVNKMISGRRALRLTSRTEARP